MSVLAPTLATALFVAIASAVVHYAPRHSLKPGYAVGCAVCFSCSAWAAWFALKAMGVLHV